MINKQDLLKLQEQAQCLLINYTNRKFKLQNHNGSMAIDGTSGHKEFGNRFEQILMMLPLLKRISIESIESECLEPLFTFTCRNFFPID